MRKILLTGLLLVLPFSCLAYDFECNGHLAYGSPGIEEQMLCRTGYAVGYDYERKVPGWVAYHLTAESVSKYHERSNRFQEDQAIPAKFRSTLRDFKYSGYDRGHLAPAASVDFSFRAMQESFLMSNIAPQLPGFNRRAWKHLEAYVRDWAISRGEVYVVTGPLFGDLIDETIGAGVHIPSAFFKVIYAPEAKNAIAFIVPHRYVTRDEIPSFIVSVDQVEQQSGLDFLNRLDDQLEAAIEDDIETLWPRRNRS